jgi:glycosyltransferase involved in cell wall biosynthesis
MQVKVLYCPVGRGLETVPFVAPPAGDPHSPVTFLYLANFIQGKGQMHALRALAAIGETRPSAQLRFVGGDMGLAKNAAYRESLVAEVERLDLKNRVEFHGPTDDIVSAIQRADIVLNFSESESFSHTCAEAGLLGRPVIATRCGGPEEIIDDGVTGLLVPPGDLGQMQRAMKELITQSELRQEMGLAAREQLMSLLSRDTFLASLADLLRGRSCR